MRTSKTTILAFLVFVIVFALSIAMTHSADAGKSQRNDNEHERAANLER
jgi:preprotein translocase subunit SecG